MSVLTSLTSPVVRRWLVPAGAALAVIGGGVAIGAITAAADPALPPRTAAELLVDLQTAKVDGLSGTVVARSDLGLPALPVGGAGSADLTSLISGTHTLRVWYASPNLARVALLGTLGETDVITNGSDVWIWSSRENKATHRTLPDKTLPDKAQAPSPMPSSGATGMTPEALAKAALALLGPSTEVTTNGSASVAGRAAYELVLAPKDPTSLIGSVRLAIDATEHVPLRVAVEARGSSDPAIDVAFTQVSFENPDPSRFTFNPPPGATVVEGTDAQATEPHDTPAPQAPEGTRPPVATIGSGWTTVLVARLPTKASGTGEPAAADDPKAMLTGLLGALPKVSGAWGSGSLLSSRLFNVLVTDDGRILVGAVSADRLYQAASDPAAKLGS